MILGEDKEREVIFTEIGEFTHISIRHYQKKSRFQKEWDYVESIYVLLDEEGKSLPYFLHKAIEDLQDTWRRTRYSTHLNKVAEYTTLQAEKENKASMDKVEQIIHAYKERQEEEKRKIDKNIDWVSEKLTKAREVW